VKTKTKKPATPSGNLKFAQAMHGKHNLTHADRRAKRSRTRAAAKRRALRDF
jgi:hypothetical protein